MTSHVRSSYSELITHCHSTFRICKIAWNYRKTANIIEKTSVYHTVNGNCASFHTSKTAKMIKVILLSSTLTFWQGALSNITFIILLFSMCETMHNAVNSVSFFLLWHLWLTDLSCITLQLHCCLDILWLTCTTVILRPIHCIRTDSLLSGITP